MGLFSPLISAEAADESDDDPLFGSSARLQRPLAQALDPQRTARQRAKEKAADFLNRRRKRADLVSSVTGIPWGEL